MRPHVRSSVVVLVVIGAALLGAPAAAASKGVSIDVGRIDVSQQLEPGGEYRLPTFGVRNPGTEATTYKLTISAIDGQDQLRPKDGWFTFEPAQLTLRPGESQAIQARITLPADAEPGAYAALIGPQISADGSGAQVGAAAAARLTFTIGESGFFEGLFREIGRLLAEQPWILVIPGLLVLLVLVRLLRRRFTFNVARRA